MLPVPQPAASPLKIPVRPIPKSQQRPRPRRKNPQHQTYSPSPQTLFIRQLKETKRIHVLDSPFSFYKITLIGWPVCTRAIDGIAMFAS